MTAKRIKIKQKIEVDGISIEMSIEQAHELRRIMGCINHDFLRKIFSDELSNEKCSEYREKFVKPLHYALDAAIHP